MIEIKRGNILDEEVDALVNTVNCVGVMGRGIALQFKHAFPENFRAYHAACRRHEVRPGAMLVVERLTSPRFIINFPTKRHWRSDSRMEDIEAGLVALVAEIRARKIRSIAIPPLGCGLGGLDWQEVRPRIEAALAAVPDVRVVLFAPDEQTTQRPVSVIAPGGDRITAGRAALVQLVDRYLNGLMEPFVTLIEIHKLMYFLQEAGAPLRLRYVKALYGPYAENMGAVLRTIEGHLIHGYGDGGDQPEKQIDLASGAVERVRPFIADNPETGGRIEKVAALVHGFETPFGLELLATVHWVISRESADNEEAVIERTYAWNARKRRFSRDQIRLAVRTLRERGWLAGSQAQHA